MNSALIRLPEEDEDGDVSCFTTSLPTVPVAPVTKTVVSLFLVAVVIDILIQQYYLSLVLTVR